MKTDAQIQSAGLGLFVCQTIIEACGGHIGIENKPDAGVLMWFTVPLTDREI